MHSLSRTESKYITLSVPHQLLLSTALVPSLLVTTTGIPTDVEPTREGSGEGSKICNGKSYKAD